MGLELFDTGIYSVADVAALTGVHPARVKRWVDGYSYPLAEGVKKQRPVWRPELPKHDGVIRLSFNDLLEVRAVDLFRKEGVSLAKIRVAVDKIRDHLQITYPFSGKKVFTDGTGIFSALRDDRGKPLLLEWSSGNYAFYQIVLANLERGIVFERGTARRWFPASDRFKKIVIDPRILFGRPVVDGTRLNVDLLASAYKAEGSIERVADLYGISRNAVRQAVSFAKLRHAA